MEMTMPMVGRYPISICCACLMHLIWSIGLLVDPGSIEATGVHMVLVITQSVGLASLLFVGVAVLAIAGLIIPGPRLARVGFILPQQIVLWFSVVGAAHAMFLGQFADGVQRSHWFLIVDQIPVVLIAMGHTAALLFIAERGDG